jgi:hypothetical protein
MKIKKKVFEVYLTTGEKISIIAERWEADYTEKRRLAFHIGEDIVAAFMFVGICGFKEVNS